jgi:glutamate synthase domain-containing protein 2
VDTLAKKGEYIPDVAIAGGFTLEDQIFKGLAMGAPYFKIIGMARSPLAAAMVGKTIGKAIELGQVPVYIRRFGNTPEEIFVTALEIKHRFGDEFDKIPTGALGVYTYLERLAQGMRQLMCGSRKFRLDLITRDDIAALTPDAARISGIDYVMDLDREEVDRILKG